MNAPRLTQLPFLGIRAVLLPVILCWAHPLPSKTPRPIPAVNIWAFRDGNQSIGPISSQASNYVDANYRTISQRFNPSIFNTKILKNAAQVRTLITTKSTLPDCITCGKTGTTAINNSLDVHWTYFDRNSDTLLVIGGGLANPRELLAPFVALFPSYDIVIFDYRGHGLDHKTSSFHGWLSRKIIGIDTTATALGNHEEEEIITTVNTFKSRKKYRTTLGLGMCYSATLFAKTQALYPNTFDKLILDGSWASGKEVAQTFVADPYLLVNPQRGNPVSRFLGKLPPFHYLFRRIAEWLFQREFKLELDALRYFAKLTSTPVLFIHADSDLLIPNEQFKHVWQAVPQQQKMAVIIPGRHLQGFIKHKELYAFVGQLFFENSYQYTSRVLLTNEWSQKDMTQIHYPG